LRESLAWLRLTAQSKLIQPSELEPAIRECGELIAILVTSIATATRNQQRRDPRPRR
jgi:hypothetical protein